MTATIRIVLSREDFAKLVRGELVSSISTHPRGSGSTRLIEILLQEMTPQELAAICNPETPAAWTDLGERWATLPKNWEEWDAADIETADGILDTFFRS